MKWFIVILFLLRTFLSAQDSTYQRLGFWLKQATLYDNHLTRFHPVDIYGNGLYSVAEFHFPNFTIVNTMFATTDSLEALRGAEKKVKGIFGYTHQAFVNVRFPIGDLENEFELGRDYVRTGYSRMGALFVGRESRPFDQARWQIHYKALTGQVVGIQLENLDSTRRYLSLHLLRWNYRDKVSITAAEALLYSGEGRPAELPFLNPVLFWTPVMVNNRNILGNGLLYAGLSWKLTPDLKLWLEGLIDDYQINRRSQGDLEPNELGLIAGIEKTSFPFPTSDFWIEYTRITNRTYQTPDPTEAYTHRGFPIGHYLGNDFDQIHLHYSHSQPIKTPSTNWRMASINLKPYLNLAYLRDGANGLDTPFDTPWEDSTVTLATGYSEPFPTKPIAYITEAELGIDCQFANGSFLTAGIFLRSKTLKGKTETGYSLVFRLWLVADRVFHY